MGTSTFTLPCLQTIIDDKQFKIAAVVTETDKKSGRKRILTAPQIKILALKHKLTVLQPVGLKNNINFLRELSKTKPDFIITFSYGQILPVELLAIPKYCAINIHPSLLPKYRGASPIESALAAGDKLTGVTFIRMSEKLDSGNILYVQKLPIESHDTAINLRTKLSIAAAKALPGFLRDFVDGKITEKVQDSSKATYCHKIEKNDGMIDLNTMDAETIFNRVRAFTPWPSCFLMLDNKRLKIIETDIDMEKSTTPGTILNMTKNTIGIGTKKGLLIPKKVQPENKRIMTIQEFLAGNRFIFNKLPASPK